MSDVIRQALSRLSSAIDRLDATAIRQADGSRARANLELELHLMREDRRQLAAMLDGERGLRAEAEEAIASIAPRVEAAIEAVKAELQDMR